MAKKKVFNSEFTGEEIEAILNRADKNPVVFYYDENNSLYRMFASAEKRDLWLSDTELYEDLELFNFVAPSPFTASFTGLTEDTKYLREGDYGTNSTLDFTWNIAGKNLDNYSDSVVITYTFENNGVTSYPVRYTHALLRVSFDMSPYLRLGTNKVTISLLGDETHASISISFVVEVLELLLESLFEVHTPILKEAAIMTIPFTIYGSGRYDRVLYFYIDGEQVGLEHVTSTENIYSNNKLISSTNIAPGKHTLLILASIVVANTTYYSNLLYFEFVKEGLEDFSLKYITTGHSFDGIEDIYTADELVKYYVTQYEEFTLDWGFYSANPTQSKKVVVWKLLYDEGEEVLSTMSAVVNQATDDLTFIPTITGECHLAAFVDDLRIADYNINIRKNSNTIKETEGYLLKLSANGRSNSEPANTINTWKYNYVSGITDITYNTTFEGFTWNALSGWNEGTLVLSNGSKIEIDCNPLSVMTVGNLTANNTAGFTFEIDFETFNTGDTSKDIIWLGLKGGASIRITPNKAELTNSTGAVKVRTNYKEGERIKLAFILNASNGEDAQLAYIINNGILERGALATDENFNAEGTIHIEGIDTGIKIHSIKLYGRALSYNEEFYNYVLDSGKIGLLLNKNNVVDSNGLISAELCEEKIDVVYITGKLSTVIGAENKLAEACVDIERKCLSNPSYSFIIKNGRIRRHGQSTLNYPIPNFKIWSNSIANTPDALEPVMYDNNGAEIYKGRYIFKEGAVPSKKWVLLANYADSSGVHNGSLLRLINDTWLNATVDNEYKLRTPPLHYINSSGQFRGNGWRETMNNEFPYVIRTGADSFPCVVFYRESVEDSYTFLGLYVFMDDKKSDYTYGERSIYNVKDDPFRLKANAPKKSECQVLWDNKDTLQFEILSVNTPYANYTNNDNWNRVQVVTDANIDRKWKFNWENEFELIYPDSDDLYGIGEDTPKDLNDRSILENRVKPFTEWIEWLVNTYKIDRGGILSMAEFKKTAAQHIDLYKMAAYYIFFLKFGLIDSVQRNALVKTYGLDVENNYISESGKPAIFWYEPWDMDVAAGNENTGGIAFDPPVDRNTQDPDNPGTYWFSGKNGTGANATSCWLWDALEAWTSDYNADGTIKTPGWIDLIVPSVALALYTAGLTYENVMHMFDDEYQNKWCERIYNQSGHYKYVENGGGDYLKYLTGARTSHRHWWIKTSFDYWDARWACGDFRKNSVTIITNTTTTGLKIKIVPSTSTYFSFYNGTNGTIEQTIEANLNQSTEPILFTMLNVLSVKDPRSIFGSLYIKELDLSEISLYMQRINLSGLYDANTGSNLTTLYLGMPLLDMAEGKFNYKNIVISDYLNLSKLQTLYLRGFQRVASFNTLLNAFTNLKSFYGEGSALTMFTSCPIGNQYEVLHLPSTIQTLTLHSSSWQELKFYYTNLEGKRLEIIDYEKNEDGSDNYDAPITEEVDAAILNTVPLTEYPENLNTVNFTGNTGNNECAKDFVLKWTTELKNRNAFEGKTLIVNDANWTGLSYELLMNIASIENLTLKGYIKLNEEPDSTLLTKIMGIFGELVFSLGTSDLTIDYDRHVLVISVPKPAIVLEDGSISIEEGNTVALLASVFSLSEEQRTQSWSLLSPEYVRINEDGTTSFNLDYATDIVEGVKIDIETGILQVPEDKRFGARQIYIIAEDNTHLNDIIQTTLLLNITKRTYPKQVLIKSNDTEYSIVNHSTLGTIGKTGTYTFYPDFTELNGVSVAFTGTIKLYKWEITNEHEKIIQYQGDNSQRFSITIDHLATKAEFETLTLTVVFNSGLELHNTMQLLFIKNVALLTSGVGMNTTLYWLYSANNYNSTQGAYYASDFLSYNGTLSFANESSYTNTSGVDSIVKKSDLVSLNNRMVNGYNTLLYLNNIDNLQFNDFVSLLEIRFDDPREEDVTWFADNFKIINLLNDYNLTLLDVTHVTALEDLNVTNCYNIPEIDLSNNLKLKTINTTGTTIDVTLPESTQLKDVTLGCPTALVIPDNTQVNKNTVNIQSVLNLDTIDLTNVSNTGYSLLISLLNRINNLNALDKTLSISTDLNYITKQTELILSTDKDVQTFYKVNNSELGTVKTNRLILNVDNLSTTELQLLTIECENIEGDTGKITIPVNIAYIEDALFRGSIAAYPKVRTWVQEAPEFAQILLDYPNVIHGLTDTGIDPYLMYDNNSWFNTECKPTAETSVTLKCVKLGSGVDALFGALGTNSSSANKLAISFTTTLNGFLLDASNYTTTFVAGNEYNITISKNKFVVNDTVVKTITTAATDLNMDAYIGTMNENNAPRTSDNYTKWDGRIYTIYWYEDEQLVHKFVPVANNTLIDVVTGKILTNLGTGDAIYETI